ncbi:MAG: AmmeMemoRadiSam system radical SAM enzyme [Pontiellaceae bacterium]|jgi:pyruvate formate lyase activating enzyme|nr:AmmeMemoRadiSam system radical SAM enzyme [Pontiellaceae bacterium]
MKTALYSQMNPDGLIECALCPRHCRIADGKHGACLIRQRRGGKLIAASYGLICGMAVDPIEKKPLYHFLPGSKTLSFGTVGCNLTCAFCQNFHLSHAVELQGTPITSKEIADAAIRHACASVAFTYNEPTVFLEFAVDTAKVCHAQGLKTVAVTNGWIEPEPRREFYSHMDAANVDLKAFTDRFYQKLCGATLQPVLDTLMYIRHETDVHLEVTTLLIPGKNDSPAEIDAMTKWAVTHLGPDVPWHFSAYRPVPEWNEAPPTPLESLLQAKSIAEHNGLQYVYLGNVHIAV